MNDQEFYSYSPLNDEKTGPFKNMSENDVNKIILKAHESFKSWSRTGMKERLSHMKKIIRVVVENMEYYAELIHKDNGKSMTEALTTEIFTILGFLEYYVRNAGKILRDEKVRMPYYLIGKSGYIRYEPLGVIGIIGPWNYPLNLSFIPAISAIISGNTVVVKHSSQTPYTGTIIEDIIKKSGLPEGVLNVVWGKGYVGEYIVRGDIQKLFFTGSTAIGRRLASICAEKLIPAELELGGSDACIILDSADLKRAARGVVWGALLNGGQTCISVERVYVTGKNHDSFVSYLKEYVGEIRMGSGEDTDIGAMTSKEQIQIVRKQLDDAVKKGAKILAGGNCKDNFFEPTLVDGCTHEMDIVNDETFGPVIAVVTTENDAESLGFANASKYGLSSSIYGNLKDVKKYIGLIQAGNVVVNNSILSFAAAPLPFGGIKESGIGRYHGKEGLKTFCNIKAVLIDKFTFTEDFTWAPYGENSFRNYLRFLKKNWGGFNPFKLLYSFPLIFKKKRKKNTQ
jgi:acyl-CoA reductase-like NAD-dependent aldehyde dehydrogenase